MKTYIKYRAWLLAICCGVSLMAVGQATPTTFTKVVNPVDGTADFPVMYEGAGAFWGDYDNDGDLDLLLFGKNDGQGGELTKFYRNNGDGTFTDATTTVLGSSFPNLHYGSAAWLDYDNDGLLDLIVSGNGVLTKLYKNQGAGANPVFALVAAPVENGRNSDFVEMNNHNGNYSGRYIAVADYDNDGYTDILMEGQTWDDLTDGGDWHRRMLLYKNNKGTGFLLQKTVFNGGLFTDLSQGMVTWGDYNNDGFQDILFSGGDGSIRPTGIYRNNGDGTFTKVTIASIVDPYGTTQGEDIWIDYDNDGFLDVLATGYDWNPGEAARLFHNNQDGTFTELSGTGIDGVYESSVTCGDLNNDGFIDIVTIGNGSSGIYYNNSGDGTFTKDVPSGYINGSAGMVTIADYNNDGKLDIFAIGYNSAGLLQNTGAAISAPSQPTNLLSLTSFVDVTLSWTAPAGESLRYNVYVTKVGGGDTMFVVPAHADGKLKVGLDNVALLTTTTYTVKGLKPGTYEWGVQAVNNGRAVSGFSVSPEPFIMMVTADLGKNASLGGAFPQKVWAGAGVLWGDYDNDGDQDLLLWGYEDGKSNVTRLYKNDNGIFVDVTDSVFRDANALPQITRGSAAWIDYDKDNLLDLVLFGDDDGNAKQMKLYKNKGVEGFEEVSTPFTAMNNGGNNNLSRVIAIADYDGDGYDDILMTGHDGTDPRFELYKNDEGAGFVLQTTPLDGTSQFPAISGGTVVWGDYNKDGKPDILYSGYDGSAWRIGIFTNNSTPEATSFELNASFSQSGIEQGEIAWIDYDADGYPDVLITGKNSGDVALLFHNNQGASFSAVSGHGIMPTRGSSIAVGDLNNDGLADLIITGTKTAVYYNMGGFFLKDTLVLPLAVTQGMVALGDYNKDGKLDVFVTGNQKTGLYKSLGVKAGQTVANLEEAFPVEGSTSAGRDFPSNLVDGAGAFWGDYDNDGDLDVLIFGRLRYDSHKLITKLYRNDTKDGGSPFFVEVTGSVLGTDFPGLFRGSAAWFDYDNDGYLDLIVSGGTAWHNSKADNTGDFYPDDPITKLYRNQGPDKGYVLEEVSSSFQAMHNEGPGRSSRYIAIGDYNNDGYQDVLMMGYGSVRHLYLYKNNKGENFSLQTAVENGHNFMEANGSMVSWGDYNNDGYQDFVFMGYENTMGYVSGVYTNKGDGTFTFMPLIDEKGNIVGAEKGDIGWIDYDNDGFLDIFLNGWGNDGGKGGGAIEQKSDRIARLLRNNGGKYFSEVVGTGIKGGEGLSNVFADLNNDGYTDILISGYQNSGWHSYIYYNNYGSGTFSLLEISGAGTQDGIATLADVDGDGDLDFFMTGTDAGVALFENTSVSTALPIPPAPPTDLALLAQNDNIGLANLSWAKAQGLANSPLRYNVFVQGTAENSPLYIIAPADTAKGTLRVGIDNLTLLTDTSYVIAGLDVGTYVWGVQAINNGRAVSAFATGSFTINKVETDNGNGDGGSTEVEKSAASSFEVFRNGESLMVVTALSSKAELAVYNFMGAKLWSKEGVFEGATEIKGLQQGNYIVALRTGNKVEVKKIVL